MRTSKTSPKEEKTRTAKKNARARRARMRKKNKNHRIEFNEPVIRTLRSDVRRRNRRTRETLHPIRPWIWDPKYRKNDLKVEAKAASPTFLGLPRELRQRICLMTLEREQIENEAAWGGDKIRTWAATLSSVTPLLRYEMGWVRAQWRKERDELKEALVAESLSKSRWSVPKRAPANISLIPNKKKKPAVILSGIEHKVAVDRRPNKCWYCEERHFRQDGKCPPERRNLLKWRRETWEVKDKKKKKAFTAK